MSEVRLDPRFEQSGLWPDFHQLFITFLRVHLAEALEPRYAAFTEERVYVAAEPIIGTIPVPDRVTERFVAIRTPEDERVTVIELLSPSNKRPGHEGREAYLKKRNALLETRVHLVEIDLLTAGVRLPLRAPDADHPLDLQVILTETWRQGRYQRAFARFVGRQG